MMRTLKVLSLGFMLLASFAPDAAAQSWVGRGYFNISLGGQSGEQTFTDSATFDIYNEKGAVAAGHSVGGGQLYDVSAGARVWKNLGVGIGYSALKNKNDATVTVRVPHPIVFGQSREASATVTDLERTENVVHLQLVWMLPLTSKFQLAFMGRPVVLYRTPGRRIDSSAAAGHQRSGAVQRPVDHERDGDRHQGQPGRDQRGSRRNLPRSRG